MHDWPREYFAGGRRAPETNYMRRRVMSSRLHRVLFVASATLAASLALAQQASSSSQAAPQSAAQPAAASSPAAQKTDADANAATSKAAADAAQKKADEVLLRDARNAGFKPEQIRGNRMFCRTATEIGSNFPVRTCYNEDQVKIKIQEYQTERNEMEASRNLGSQIH